MKHRSMLFALLAALAAPVNYASAQDATQVTRAIGIVAELQGLYPTLKEPRQKLAASAQLITTLDLLLRLSPPQEHVPQLTEMKGFWERRRLSDLEGTVADAEKLNKRLASERDSASRVALLRAALADFDAMLEHLPKDAESLRINLTRERAEVLEALESEQPAAGRKVVPDTLSPIHFETNDADNRPEAATRATNAAALPVESRAQGGTEDPTSTSIIPSADVSTDPQSELSPAAKVKAGLSRFLAILSAAAIVILLAGPIVGIVRWMLRTYLKAVRTIWNRYAAALPGEPVGEKSDGGALAGSDDAVEPAQVRFTH